MNISFLANRIAGGLKRKSITKCSDWALAYRVMGKPYPGPWRFEHHPWTRQMHDDPAEEIIGQKSAQMGYTEVALNKAFYAIDVLGESVLYVLPATTPDATDFSTSRFDPALELSSHLQNLFSDVKNIGHKRAGSANLFVRGSRSRGQLKSLPVARMIFDELEEMVQENVTLAGERTSGQIDKQSYYISTPSIDNYGINARFRNSTENHFYFNCPHCSRKTELIFPECLVITAEEWTDPNIRNSYIICKECRQELPHNLKPDWLKTGVWVPSYSNKTASGYYINQLYSCTLRPYEIAQSWLKAQLNPTDEQEFYNSKLGLTHIVEGARVTDQHIETCTGQHKILQSYGGHNMVTMGVDVGKWLHIEIIEWHISIQGEDVNVLSKARVIYIGKVLHFEELDHLMRDFKVHYCVIDANPERRKALEFSQRFQGRVSCCFYARGISSKVINANDDQHTVSVDRTTWLDLSMSRFRKSMVTLPIDTPMEYKQHAKALVRIYDKDEDGNPVGKYVCGNEEDHYAHAHNYAEIALPLAAGVGVARDVKVNL